MSEEDRHPSYVEIVFGPEGAVVPGSVVDLRVVVVPQSERPKARTVIALRMGPRGRKKETFKLYDGKPGTDPAPLDRVISYTVRPGEVKPADHENVVLDIEWVEDGKKPEYIDSIPVAPEAGQKYNFRINLSHPLPKTSPVGTPLSIEVDALTQNKKPKARSQIMLRVKDAGGAVSFALLSDQVPKDTPEIRRVCIVQEVPEDSPEGELEIGWVACQEEKFDLEKARKKVESGGYKTIPLGTVQIVGNDQHCSSDAESIAPSASRKAAEYIEKLLEKDAKQETDEVGEKTGKGISKAAKKEVQNLYERSKGVAWGARRLLARETTGANMAKGALGLAGGRNPSSSAAAAVKGVTAVGVASSLGKGMTASKALKLGNPVSLISKGGDACGERIGGEIGGLLGSEAVGKELGSFVGAVGAGAVKGSVVPGVGTVAGATGAAVSWGVKHARKGKKK